MYRDAAEHISFFLSTQRPDSPADRRAAGEAVLREASAKVATVRLRIDVDGAEVLVDGRPIGTAPLVLPIFFDPGHHTLEARQDDYPWQRVPIEAVAGTSSDVVFKLKTELIEPLPTTPRAVVPGAVLGGVVGAALVTGIVLLAEGAAKRGDSRTLNDAIQAAHRGCVTGAANFDAWCTELNDAVHRSDTFHNAGVGVLVGAGAAAVGTVAYFVWPASTPSKPRALTIAPMLSAANAGLLFSGSF
jgi:hypothetical protein